MKKYPQHNLALCTRLLSTFLFSLVLSYIYSLISIFLSELFGIENFELIIAPIPSYTFFYI